MRGQERTVLQVLSRSAGGIARHVADVSGTLDGEAGLRIEVAGPADLPIRIPATMHDLSIPEGALKGHLPAIKRLRSIIRELGCDVVHAHGLRAGIDAAAAARGLGMPVVLTVHNLVRAEIAGRAKAPLYKRAEDLAVVLADHVLCVSEQIARHLRSSVGRSAGKIEVLYLGLEDPGPVSRPADQVRLEAGISSSDERLCVSVSRLAPQKALHVLLEAIALLPRTRLAILGEGPLGAELRARAGALGIGDRVQFLGFRADASDFIAAADVFCLSSIWEGVPLAAQEAILLGTPVVATDVGGMPELIEDRRSGRLCSPNDVGGLRDALDEVLTDPAAAERYAGEALAALKRRFSRDRMLERLVSIYKEGVHAS